MTREIVIAAYDKYLDWLDKFNSDIKVTVYRKGEDAKQREDETWALYHPKDILCQEIQNNYYNTI